MTFIGKLVASLAYRYLAWATPLPKGVSTASPSQTPRINFPLLVYSHRGGDREVDPSCGLRYVENTLPAFRNSVAVGGCGSCLVLSLQARNTPPPPHACSSYYRIPLSCTPALTCTTPVACSPHASHPAHMPTPLLPHLLFPLPSSSLYYIGFGLDWAGIYNPPPPPSPSPSPLRSPPPLLQAPTCWSWTCS